MSNRSKRTEPWMSELPDWMQQVICFVLLVFAIGLITSGLMLLSGCKSVRGAVSTTSRTDPAMLRKTTGEQQQYQRDEGAARDFEMIIRQFNQAGQAVIEAWGKASAHQLPVTVTATSRPSVIEQTIGASVKETHAGPIVTGTSNVTLDGDRVEAVQQRKDWGWIYPIAGVVALLLSAGAAGLKQYRLAAILAGLGAVLMSWAWLGPWIAGLIGAAIALALLYVIYLMTETQWRDSLPGIAKLLREGKDEEAIAALRASTPELDAAYKAAGKDTNK